MGLNCGCPLGAALPDLTLPECGESLGQIQKVIFQRIFSTTGTKNTIASASDKKATWTKLMAAKDGTKTLISPYLMNPTTDPGAARTFGGGNASLNGIEIVIGREPTSFTSMLYQQPQSVIASLKQLMCENVGVYLVDENGNIAALSAKPGGGTEAPVFPIPIQKLFIGDKKLGGLEEPDSNTMEWSFLPNWSDNLVIIKPSDFNPLSDLVNGAAA